MAHAELKVDVRESRGKRSARRQRKTGTTPAVLYGHGAETLSLSVPSDELDALVNHGNRMVALTGAVSQSAFIREVQWDVWGTHVLHVDFARVSADEKVELQLAIELRGEAPGIRDGGVVEQLVHEALIECPAGSIPEKIRVSVNELKLDDTITLGQLELPEGASVLGVPSKVVVQCVVPAEVPDEEDAEAVPGEPEVIGAKDKEEEGDD